MEKFALEKYADRLYERRGEGVIVQPATASVGGWQPSEHECHQNVTDFCACNPGYSPVRGWLYFDFGGFLGKVQFLAHSVVRAPDGTLYDITPCRASQLYPFIVAEESEAEYAALNNSGVIRIWHPIV